MDLAGNSLRAARSVGALTAQPNEFIDSVSQRDRIDFYRFKMTRRSTFYVSLSQLTANANIELTSQTGKSIVRSAQSGANSEALLQTLKAGIYYLKVYQGKGTTQYQLRLSAANAANLPVTNGNALPGDRWLYQLQEASIPAINVTTFNLLTIDYSQDGTDPKRYTRADLDSLHNAGKNVLGYLSIGEAEDYRYYFQNKWVASEKGGLKQPVSGSAPPWLDRTNPDWEGNYKVQYWSEEWQTIVLNYLDRMIDAGFNGVYLDIIDGFEYWSDPQELKRVGSKRQALTEPDAAGRMIQFVERIAYHARIMRGKTDFQIVPQNGESILNYDQNGRYLQTISGIGIEDLFYDGLTSRTPTNKRLEFLDKVQATGKTVLSVDYVDDGTGSTGTNGTRINDFLNQARGRGYLPYAAFSDRDLNRINEINE